MANIFKGIHYILYMAFFQLKGIKYFFISKFIGKKAASDYVQRIGYLWSKFTINIIGIELDIKGTENIPDVPCVYISNHSSILDIPIILYTSNKKMGFISKKEILKVPVIGYWLKRSGSIALDRDNPRNAIKCINECSQNLQNGYSIGLFPSGTRSKDGSVGEFKKGSLKFATKAKVPIVPISINLASSSFEDTGKFIPSKISVVYDKPIYTENLTKNEEKDLAQFVQNIVEKNM